MKRMEPGERCPSLNRDPMKAAKKPTELPFYETPDHVVTSSKIITEAKSSLKRSQLRSIPTRRPETPQESQRKLFPCHLRDKRDGLERPPSAFSLDLQHFESDSRPVSGTKLLPLDHSPQTAKGSKTDGVLARTPKPPADPNRPIRRSTSRQRLYQRQFSPTFDTQPSHGRTASLHDVSLDGVAMETTGKIPETGRRVHSGPKERTKYLVEERGEGDGSEVMPRVCSRSSTQNRTDATYAVSTDAGNRRPPTASPTDKDVSRHNQDTGREGCYYRTHVAPVLEQITALIPARDHDKLAVLSQHLYDVLAKGQLLGRACQHRSTILKTLFKLLDLSSPGTLLRLARVILALKVSGNNLINVCKLVFKVSREEKNDVHFLDGNILDLLIETAGNVDHLDMATESLVYCVGALKFLSASSVVVRHLVKRGAVHVLAALLAGVNAKVSDTSESIQRLGHILIQLTAMLRNLADVTTTRQEMLSTGVVGQLCQLLDNYQGDADLMLNVTRIFSKLTLHTDCCTELSSKTCHFAFFIRLLKQHLAREDLVVRVCFILGNLTAKNDSSRRLLFEQPDALETLLLVLKSYFELDLKQANSDEKATVSTRREDVLVKVIRVIANISMNPEVGPSVAASEPCILLLIDILEHKTVESNEEVILTTMTTINNLSFYMSRPSAIIEHQVQLAHALMKFLEAKNMASLAEATRVFGNLSREATVRDFLAVQKVDEAMVAMLDSDKVDVVFTACGVLINLMADEDKRPTLRRMDGIRKLTDVLRDWGPQDWQLASMVCQTLWNYSGKITSSSACFGEKEAQDLADLLVEYLDMEMADNEGCDSAMTEYLHDVWQTDFVPVATQLLNRIESHQSNFDILENPS